MEDFEQRLSLLEESKDKEISVLEDQKNVLEGAISEAKTQIASLQRQIKELTASNQIFANEVRHMKSRTENEKSKKMNSIRERLAAIESKSVSGGPQKDLDDSSQVSGMSSIFSSTPSSAHITSPRHSPRSRSRSRVLDNMDTRSGRSLSKDGLGELNNVQFDKKWISKYKSAKKKDLEGIFPSSMTVTGLSLEGEDLSVSGSRSLHTSPMIAPYNTQKQNVMHLRNKSPLDPNLRWNDVRDASPSITRDRMKTRDPSPSVTRERIMAMLKD